MTWGLNLIISGQEVLFTRELINIFTTVSLRYPPVPTTSGEVSTKDVTYILTITSPPTSGTINWMTQSIKQPVDTIINLGGPTNGIGYNGNTFQAYLISITPISSTTYSVYMKVSYGSPSDFVDLTFYTAGGI